MNKTATAILSLAAFAVGFLLTYYTGLLTPVIAWVSVNVLPHVNNFYTALKSQPVFSTLLGGLASATTYGVAKSVYTSQKDTAVQAVKTTSETQINGLQNQLYQTGKAQTASEKTIEALQQQITEFKAAKPDNNEQLLEAQQLVVTQRAEIDRLRSDYNALIRIKAEAAKIPTVKELIA